MKNKIRNIILVLLIAIIGFNNNVLADEEITANCENEESCPVEDTINSDEEILSSSVVEFDEKVTLESDISGSTVLVGEKVKHEKNVDGISILLAQSIEFNGNTEHLLSIGKSVEINGIVNKELFVAGSNVKVSDEAIINRDAIIVASNVELKGNFKRDILIFGEDINLTNVNIEGDIQIYASNIIIGENTVISGKLEYSKDAEIEIDEKAEIKETNKLDNFIKEKNYKYEYINKIFSIIRLIVLFMALNLLIPKAFVKLNNYSKESKLDDMFWTFCWGVVGLFCIPLVCIILMISILGTSVGLILFILYLIMIYASSILFSYVLGNIICNKIFNKECSNLIMGLIGIIIISLLKLISVVEPYVIVLSIVMGFGILIKNLKRKSN